jgi:hypothetical protein
MGYPMGYGTSHGMGWDEIFENEMGQMGQKKGLLKMKWDRKKKLFDNY